MLMKLRSYIFLHYQAYLVNVSKKSIKLFKRFSKKKPIIQNHPKKSNSRNRGKQNQRNFHRAKIKGKYTFWSFKYMFLPSFIIIIKKKLRFKFFCDLFEIKHTEFCYSFRFDLQYTKVLNNVISFYPSNLICVKFKVIWFRDFMFIVAMERSINFKDTL